MVKSGTGIACVLVAALGANAQSRFLVADRTGDRVVRFNWPSATVIDHLVATGVSALDDPMGIALPGDGYLYLASAKNNCVIRYDAETGEPEYPPFVSPGSGGLSLAADLAFGPDGNLYVASHTNDRVLRYNGKTGKFIDTFIAAGLGGLDSPHGLAFDHDGNLIVCSQYNAKLLMYRPDGSFDHEIDTSNVVMADLQKIIIGGDGSMYIASLGTDSVVKVPPEGPAFALIDGGLDDPTGLALDPDGNLLVANWGGVGSIEKYTSDTGQFLQTVMSSLYAGMSGDLGTILFVPDREECRPDMDGNGVLDLFDFLQFFNEFAAGC